jgi:hypothetical protein
MNIQELSSALPKPWLSINANSLSSNDVVLNSSVSTNSGTGTLPITPANLVNGVIGSTAPVSTTFTIQLPTAAELNAYFLSLSSTVLALNSRFSFYVSSSAGSVNILIGGGVSTFNAATEIAFGPNTQKQLIFVKTGASTWVVYF